MEELPEPLVPAEVDLRDYDFMPFYGKRIFESDTWLLCDADEKVAALRLWWRSWHEEPTGSLPSNDRILADAAGYGVAVRAFLVVKANALRGWILCADGRLYHPVVASIAIDVWKTKRKKKADNAADRERKRLKRLGLCPPETPEFPPEVLAENPLKGREEDITDADASVDNTASEVRRERGSRGHRLAPDWQPTGKDREFAAGCGLDPDATGAEFRDYWIGVPGQKGCKLDWSATFRNRCRDIAARNHRTVGLRSAPQQSRPTPAGVVAALDRVRLAAPDQVVE